MPIKNNDNIVYTEDVNITWMPCSKCGVLSYKSNVCKPCKYKIQLLYADCLNPKNEINTLIDILIRILCKICKSSIY